LTNTKYYVILCIIKRLFKETPVFTKKLESYDDAYWLYVYGKDEADDLTNEEKKAFKALVEKIKGEKK
jgi:hypothetical protein